MAVQKIKTASGKEVFPSQAGRTLVPAEPLKKVQEHMQEKLGVSSVSAAMALEHLVHVYFTNQD
tara:strand:+ start:1621 stop:1812 length:192 start_codon:yes stop_codon:yes gene_type:complete